MCVRHAMSPNPIFFNRFGLLKSHNQIDVTFGPAKIQRGIRRFVNKTGRTTTLSLLLGRQDK